MKPEDPYPTGGDSQCRYIDAFGLDVPSSQKRHNEDRIEHGPNCTSGGSAIAMHI